jgi:hypothetical protein
MVTVGPGVGEDKAAVAWAGSEEGFVWVVRRRTATSTVAMVWGCGRSIFFCWRGEFLHSVQ